MLLNTIGQRCMSEPEPELGLGVVVSVDKFRIGVHFPSSGEERLYAFGTPVLKRVRFREGESIVTREGVSLFIESVDEVDGLFQYSGNGTTVSELEITDAANYDLPQERLMKGNVDPGDVFTLRHQTLQLQHQFRKSPVRGFLGGRVDLIPHQMSILHEVAHRQIPRVLLADEVGLGKTIEACLILQRLLAVGKVRRVLILVPESLIHQWFVELLRRFNFWFSIFDEERCRALEQNNTDGNPFEDEQLALCSVDFLMNSEVRRQQIVEAEWDLVIVDEAHHLEWTPEAVSPEYELVETLAGKSFGLLLLTATPTQLGMEGHFARLRLLDPDRYHDYGAFLEETEEFGTVARIAGKIIDGKSLNAADKKSLLRIFNKDPDGLNRHLAALTGKQPGARSNLIRALLDEHGTGRVIFRNTRAGMSGFPERQYCPEPLPSLEDADENITLLNRLARELEAEETGMESSIRYSFKQDPRIDWLVSFLKKHRQDKLLLICKSPRKAIAVETALREKINVKVGLFHELLPLVKRDRNAAWFAESDGAQLLICSEIGSEGRNFQFAHHLAFFDIPLNPGLVEQRIGRLDRIGQTETIRIHVPFVERSCQEFVADWYDRGISAFDTSLHGGNAFVRNFRDRVLNLALRMGNPKTRKKVKSEWQSLVEESRTFRNDMLKKLKNGRDRLLELNSHNPEVAGQVIDMIRQVDGDGKPREHLCELFDHFGVRITEHEEGDVFLDATHSYVEAYPCIPHEGLLATFDRQRAISREDIVFISPDHPVFRDSMDLLINSKAGTTAFQVIDSDQPNILLESVFVLETMASKEWHREAFLPPKPLRILVDIRGNDLSHKLDNPDFRKLVRNGDIHRFLERPGFNEAFLKMMVEGASDIAEERASKERQTAMRHARDTLMAEIQRLIDLRKINDQVSEEEIELATGQLKLTLDSIDNARLRLDSICLIAAGPDLE